MTERCPTVREWECPPLAYGLPLRGRCRRLGGEHICGICAGDLAAPNRENVTETEDRTCR